jgi:hypothetical protein
MPKPADEFRVGPGSAMMGTAMIDVVVFFFLLGVLARLVGSDLKLPEALYETLG